ncbi:MAG: homoserine O-succinyltransferase [Oscillospiraceae bacterium]|nr:homoserine O-succinyltransferase [Oscillospiraceae bacterium]
MPIRVNEEMPVVKKLEEESIFVMPEHRAETQDIRQLQIVIVNIMPEKEASELRLLRLLSNSPLQTEVTFVRLSTHRYRNISASYLRQYYVPFAKVRERYFDGMIITGAPVENLPYEQVDYWDELAQIMEWSKTHVTSTMHICWGAQAGLYYHYGIKKYALPKKLSGIYDHRLVRQVELTRGFDDVFCVPHSRYTGVHTADVRRAAGLHILAESDAAGVYLAVSDDGRRVFVHGHPEYEAGTLAAEYKRDVKKGISPEIPEHYFPVDDPAKKPCMRWRGHANLLFSNWLNYYVYQVTPYEFAQKEGNNTQPGGRMPLQP